MFLGWYDPDKKKSATGKLADAVERYADKWERRPTVALVNPNDATTITTPPLGIEVRPMWRIAPNTFFVGEDDEL